MTIAKHVALPCNTMGDSPLVGSGSVNPNIDYRLQSNKKKKKKKKKWKLILTLLIYYIFQSKKILVGRVTKVP